MVKEIMMKVNVMKKMKDSRGFTLIEVIISIALVGIISISFLTLYTSAYSGIAKAGHRTSTVQIGKASIEDALAQQNVAGLADTGGTNATISIQYQGNAAANFTASGKQVSTTKTYSGNTVTIVSFIPD